MANAHKLFNAWRIEQGLSLAEVARRMGLKNYQSLSQFAAGKVGNPHYLYRLARMMGRTDIERFVLGLPSLPPSNAGFKEPIQGHAMPQTETLLRPPRPNLLPVLSWDEIDAFMLIHNQDFPPTQSRQPNGSLVNVGPRAKVLRVPDGSMIPRLPLAGSVIVDPNAQHADGDLVLVRMLDGAHHLRAYTALADGGFEVSSIAPAQTWNSVRHGVTVVARVMRITMDL